MVLGICEGELTHVIVHFKQVMLLQRFLLLVRFMPGNFLTWRSEPLDLATLEGAFHDVYLELEEGLRLLHHSFKEGARR